MLTQKNVNEGLTLFLYHLMLLINFEEKINHKLSDRTTMIKLITKQVQVTFLISCKYFIISF